MSSLHGRKGEQEGPGNLTIKAPKSHHCGCGPSKPSPLTIPAVVISVDRSCRSFPEPRSLRPPEASAATSLPLSTGAPAHAHPVSGGVHTLGAGGAPGTGIRAWPWTQRLTTSQCPHACSQGKLFPQRSQSIKAGRGDYFKCEDTDATPQGTRKLRETWHHHQRNAVNFL